jgi:hypothetical protein
VPPKVIVLALTTGGTVLRTQHVAECPDLGPRCATNDPPASYNHVQKLVALDATVDAQLGVLPWLSIAATVPFRMVVTRIHYTDASGRDYTPDPPDTHHRNETLGGLADPTISALMGRAFGRFGFAIRVGGMLPLGKTLSEDPYLAGRQGREHEHIQFGTGIFRPVLGSAMGVDLGAIGFDGWFLATGAFSTNGAGYRPGQRVAGGVRITSALGLRSFRFGLGGELAHESAETWQDTVGDDGNRGRTDVLAVATARWSPSRALSLFGALRVPLVTDVVGAQLSYPLYVQLGIATAFAR